MNVEAMETKENIKVGVIGMGRIGLVHLEAISKAPGVQPVIISNPTITKAEAGKLLIRRMRKILVAVSCHEPCSNLLLEASSAA